MADDALVPRGETLPTPSTREPFLGGAEDITASDLRFTFEARITRDGKWKIGREEVKEFRAVFLRCTRFRKLNEGSDADIRTVCASMDGFVPQPDVARPKNRRCAEQVGSSLEPVCLLAKWDHDPVGKWIPPVCNEGLALLGIRIGDSSQPFWMALTKTARQEAERLLEDLKSRGAQMLHNFGVTCRVKQRKSPGRSWSVPDFVVEDGMLPLEQYQGQYERVRDVRYIPRVSAGSRSDEEEAIDVTPTPEDDDKIPF